MTGLFDMLNIVVHDVFSAKFSVSRDGEMVCFDDIIQTRFQTMFEKELLMPVLFLLLTLFTGLSIPLLPLLTGFFPGLGLAPLKFGHMRSVRLMQVLATWGWALAGLWLCPSFWGWLAIALAAWFSFVAANFFPERIFVALEQPVRAETGLAESAPVLATEVGGEVVAYPLETLVPHHLINDILGGRPILAAW
jgi:hypothetical protein